MWLMLLHLEVSKCLRVLEFRVLEYLMAHEIEVQGFESGRADLKEFSI